MMAGLLMPMGVASLVGHWNGAGGTDGVPVARVNAPAELVDELHLEPEPGLEGPVQPL